MGGMVAFWGPREEEEADEEEVGFSVLAAFSLAACCCAWEGIGGVRAFCAIDLGLVAAAAGLLGAAPACMALVGA